MEEITIDFFNKILCRPFLFTWCNAPPLLLLNQRVFIHKVLNSILPKKPLLYFTKPGCDLRLHNLRNRWWHSFDDDRSSFDHPVLDQPIHCQDEDLDTLYIDQSVITSQWSLGIRTLLLRLGVVKAHEIGPSIVEHLSLHLLEPQSYCLFCWCLVRETLSEGVEVTPFTFPACLSVRVHQHK